MASVLMTDLYSFPWLTLTGNSASISSKPCLIYISRGTPFQGEYTVFAGLEECIRFIANFRLKDEEISYLRSVLPSCEEGFFDYLKEINCSDVEVYAILEGSVVFPKVPLLRVEGPIAGPDGEISASKYCYMDGFDVASNVAAGRLCGTPTRGTHSHAFVSSFMGPDEIVDKAFCSRDGSVTFKDFVSLVQTWLTKLQWRNSLRGIFGETNQSELAAFTPYTMVFPNNFLALVDTYDVERMRLVNISMSKAALISVAHLAVSIVMEILRKHLRWKHIC